MVTHQLQVQGRPGNVRRSKTDVLPLSCSTSVRLQVLLEAESEMKVEQSLWSFFLYRLFPIDYPSTNYSSTYLSTFYSSSQSRNIRNSCRRLHLDIKVTQPNNWLDASSLVCVILFNQLEAVAFNSCLVGQLLSRIQIRVSEYPKVFTYCFLDNHYIATTGRRLTEKADVTDIVNFSPLCPTIQSGSLRFR